MKTVAVIIPIYKPIPSGDEVISFRRTLSILKYYDIMIICPEKLDTSIYDAISREASVLPTVVRFDNTFFQSIIGYNRLLLSPLFYNSFSEYNFILICQLDAFVFRDELKDWCQKGYDYIGAPLVGDYQDTVFSNKMRVGNGGFSLRNVQTILHFFGSKKNVFSPKQAAQRIALWKKPQTRLLLWIMMLFGWRNKPLTVAAKWKYNEDDFWSGLLDKSEFALRKPAPEEAMLFSFERFPSELFKLTGNKLPFGCHAWNKYEFNEFWQHLISQADAENSI